MKNRLKAEQKLCDKLYNEGIIHSDAEFFVRRLDFGQPFSVFMDKEIIGICDYNPQQNRFINFKVRKPKRNKQYIPKNSMIDYLRDKKIKISR